MSSIATEKVGTRVYVTGNTFSVKDRLKSAGCHWDGDRRQWWIGAAKAESIAAIVGTIAATTASSDGYAKPTPEQLAEKRCYGKVEYKGRQYYVVGRSDRTGKLHLTVIDCSIDFWAAEAECRWVKEYHGREERGAYGRSTGRMVYQTVGGIRAFIGREKAADARGEERCAECGRTGELVADLEDGLLKHRHCCDIAP